ncbi:hypothetical protein HPB51_021248 [Rhipicephalus microplus]|uniref:Uncharacterized protein n=1 Tax=Rhipicephalus microplus TaxID=6941 RepID=A0A9J6F7W4_RHIMP|nr:hypothetical protein HPB51_021248 [Rhipicephalus microplus]
MRMRGRLEQQQHLCSSPRIGRGERCGFFFAFIFFAMSYTFAGDGSAEAIQRGTGKGTMDKRGPPGKQTGSRSKESEPRIRELYSAASAAAGDALSFLDRCSGSSSIVVSGFSRRPPKPSSQPPPPQHLRGLRLPAFPPAFLPRTSLGRRRRPRHSTRQPRALTRLLSKRRRRHVTVRRRRSTQRRRYSFEKDMIACRNVRSNDKPWSKSFSSQVWVLKRITAAPGGTAATYIPSLSRQRWLWRLGAKTEERPSEIAVAVERLVVPPPHHLHLLSL